MSNIVYDVDIVRGRSDMNDAIFDYLKSRIAGDWLDVGCNTGQLLSEVGNGIGIDSSPKCVEIARERGIESVFLADALDIPFADSVFDTVVLSCVLEQIANPDWRVALSEAIRVARGKVIGINPIPNSEWGKIHGWVKSIIDPETLKLDFGAEITPLEIEGKYYFEISKY